MRHDPCMGFRSALMTDWLDRARAKWDVQWRMWTRTQKATPVCLLLLFMTPWTQFGPCGSTPVLQKPVEILLRGIFTSGWEYFTLEILATLECELAIDPNCVSKVSLGLESFAGIGARPCKQSRLPRYTFQHSFGSSVWRFSNKRWFLSVDFTWTESLPGRCFYGWKGPKNSQWTVILRLHGACFSFTGACNNSVEIWERLSSSAAAQRQQTLGARRVPLSNMCLHKHFCEVRSVTGQRYADESAVR